MQTIKENNLKGYNIGGFLFPSNDQHFKEMLEKSDKMYGRAAYQYNKYKECKKYIKNYRNALDIGSHIGLWSFYLAQEFSQVFAFEVFAKFHPYFEHNVKSHRVKLNKHGLGYKEEVVNIRYKEENSGSTFITDKLILGDTGLVKPLDDCNFFDIDFIKIDVEGYEHNVIRGAIRTIVENKPIILIEQKKNRDALKYLTALGMKEIFCIGGDYIMGW